MNRRVYFCYFFIIMVFFAESLAAQVFVQKKGAGEGEFSLRSGADPNAQTHFKIR